MAEQIKFRPDRKPITPAEVSQSVPDPLKVAQEIRQAAAAEISSADRFQTPF
jgi:hypothetical protein